MSDEKKPSYRERLLWAMKKKGLMNQSELARRIGVKPQSIQHLLDPKKNAQGSSHSAALAAALEVSPSWLATGEGTPDAIVIDGQHRHFARMKEIEQLLDQASREIHPDLLNDLLILAEPGLAHDMSQARNTESLPRVRWEDLMSADLSRPFELEVVDDALAPEIFQGCIALLDPHRPPEPAWPVLVKDRDGNYYLRDFEAGPAGSWSAVSRARGYRPLDSETYGLTIIAAMDGYKRPRPVR